MANKIPGRGFDPNDDRWFSNDALAMLKRGQEEVQWLLDRGYRLDVVVPFIGNHYLLSARQRLALQRTSALSLQYEGRRNKMLSFEAAKDGCINIDGFNLIITLEVALSKSIILLGTDGVIRDLAGLRGSYHIIEQTDNALKLIGKCLKKLSVPKVKFYLDAPVSNSGRLKSRILEHAVEWGMPVEAELVPNPDVILSELERVVTSDSVILDSCSSWFNLSRKIIEDYIADAWVVSFERYDATY
ncbi:MAG: DUF434 domain-containing protein [Pseudomonadota bacterium]